MLHYWKNHNYSDYINMNDDSKNNISNESRYLHFLKERIKETINYGNNMNIYEKNSKIMKSKKNLLILKRTRQFSKKNSFDKDLIKDKNLKLYKDIKENTNKNNLNMKILNEKKKINCTINENELLNKNEKFDSIININNKKKDDEKYLKFKKEIFEKAFQNFDEKVKMVKNIN